MRGPPRLSNLHLEDDEVHIWRVCLDFSNSAVEILRKLLLPEEAARADRFHAEANSKKFIVARAALRRLLGGYLGIDPLKVQLTYLEYGKPILKESINPEGLNFNLAHSGNLALYALTLRRQIGVDLEHINRDFAVDDIAHRFFSTSEIERLDKMPAAQRHDAFFSCWTRKEAFIKALGLGLSLPLNQFDVTLLPSEPVALLRTQWNEAEISRWSMSAVPIQFGYAAAVAVEGHDWRLRVRDLDEYMLIQDATYREFGS